MAWPLALLAALSGRAGAAARGRRAAWIAIVAAMTMLGFAGLPRFMAPAAAIVCVLGGVGLAGAAARPAAASAALAGLSSRSAAVITRWPACPAASATRRTHGAAADRTAASHDRLRAVVRAIGDEPLLRCGRLATSDVLVRTALAWELGVPLSQVVSFGAPSRRSGAFVVGLAGVAGPARRDARRREPLLGARGEWSVYSVACPLTASSSSAARSAGVVGRGAVGLDPRPRLLVVLAVGVDRPQVVRRARAVAFSTARRAVSIEWSELL